MSGTHPDRPCDKTSLCRYFEKAAWAASKLLFRELRDAQATMEVSETRNVTDLKMEGEHDETRTF